MNKPGYYKIKEIVDRGEWPITYIIYIKSIEGDNIITKDVFFFKDEDNWEVVWQYKLNDWVSSTKSFYKRHYIIEPYELTDEQKLMLIK
jgi:hypothetical protein